MLPGDQAPDFTLPDQQGRPVTLSALWEEGPVVLFFFPAAMTSGCTAESCHFRDLGGQFAALGASRVGISHDAVDRQLAFSELHGFDYPLLSDTDGAVAERFGVRRRLPLLHTRRWTFVLSRGGRLLEVVKSEMHMQRHADRALEVLAATR